jgi:hypothetical protein
VQRSPGFLCKKPPQSFRVFGVEAEDLVFPQGNIYAFFVAQSASMFPYSNILSTSE